MAALPTIPRGSLVVYAEKLYYYQPNGRSCYLYHSRDDIGDTRHRQHSVARSQVRMANADDIDTYGMPPAPTPEILVSPPRAPDEDVVNPQLVSDDEEETMAPIGPADACILL